MMVISELCKCFYKLKKSSELEKYAKKGLLIAQENIVSKYFIGLFYSYLGDSYALAGKYDLAIKYLDLSIKNNPYSKDSYKSICYCLESIHKYRDAIEYAKRIELIDTKFFQDNKINESIEVLEKQELESNPVSLHLALALKYLNEKNLKNKKRN